MTHFSNELREVCFNRTAFGHERLPPNEMDGVDFTRAQLRLVEFRDLDMANVRFPNDEDHIILHDYPAALDRLLRILKTRTDVASKKLTADLTILRKWAGSRQRQGVLNRNDLVELVGDESTKESLELVSA